MEQLRYIALFIALVAGTSSHAQKYFGISGGLVNNVLAGSEIDFQRNLHNNKMSARTGPTFSVFMKNEFHHSLYLKYEAAYIRKGNSSPNNVLWTLNLEYISVPLKIGIQRRLNKNLKLGVEGGVAFNYALGHSTDQLADAFSTASKSKVNKFALSALAGLNLEYQMASRRVLFFNPGWYHDLTPLLSYENGNATYKAGNKGWVFVVGLLFPLHKS